MKEFWQTSKRQLDYSRKTLVMGILNITPDSFSDGGNFFSADAALRQAEKLINEGADILDIGGESTRPNSQIVSVEDETARVAPLIEAITKRFEIAVSIDTSKSEVAAKAIEAGAEIINDVSGLRFDEKIAEVAAKTNAGLVLMHLRGTFATMHKLPPVENILSDVKTGFNWSLEKAKNFGVKSVSIALDIGVGFSKTIEQNLELLANMEELVNEFSEYPILSGTSRKSFLGKILSELPPDERINGSISSAAIAVWNGARIVRVHDVRATVEALKVVDAIRFQRKACE